MDHDSGPADAEVFLQELHDALLHLRDLPIRRTHPISRHLGPTAPTSTRELQRLLLEAIEQLRPPLHVAADTARSRRYRYLTLRYVEGSRLDEVVAELGISSRQARREHRLALEELAALLLPAVPKAMPTAVSPPPARALPTELETEIAQVESAPPSEPIDLRATIDDARDLISRFATSRSVVVESQLSDDLPPVVAARTVLRQILLNLMSYYLNAGLVGTLRIRATETTAGVDVAFVPEPAREQAIGLAPVHPSADSARSLEAASRLAESQEGSIRVDETTAGRPVVHLLLLTTQATLVLVVDDNPSLVRLFRRFVRGEGFRLAQARNGIRAHQLARALRPDVIILDLMMPIQDGWDLFRALQRDATTTPIPIVACSILPERELALSLGAHDFLPKPVTPESLLTALGPFRRSAGGHPPPGRDGGEHRGSSSNMPSLPRPLVRRGD